MKKIGISDPLASQPETPDLQPDQSKETTEATPPDTSIAEDVVIPAVVPEIVSPANLPLYRPIRIGPFVNLTELDQIRAILNNHLVDFQEVSGTGPVKMFRLFEGSYPINEGLERLAIIKKSVNSAFSLPDGDQIRLYAGSFHDYERALAFMTLLKRDQINLTIEENEVDILGKILLVNQVEEKTADKITEQIKASKIVAPLVSQHRPSEPKRIHSETIIGTHARDLVKNTLEIPASSARTEKDTPTLETEPKNGSPDKLPLQNPIRIGPFVNLSELDQTRIILNDQGVEFQEKSGTGPVKMFRLFEGAYLKQEAYERLDIIKKSVDSAFFLTDGDKLRLYAGSFHDYTRAFAFKILLLKENQISVALEENIIDIQGKILLVKQAQPNTARTITERMETIGITALLTP